MIILYVPELPNGQTRPFVERCRAEASKRWPMVGAVVRNPRHYNPGVPDDRLPGAPNARDNVVDGVVVHSAYASGEYGKPNVAEHERAHGVDVIVVDGPAETTGTPVPRTRRAASVEELVAALRSTPAPAPVAAPRPEQVDEAMVAAMCHVPTREMPKAVDGLSLPFVTALYERDPRSVSRTILRRRILELGGTVPELPDDAGGDDSGDDQPPEGTE